MLDFDQVATITATAVGFTDGTDTISKNRVTLPAGGWYHYYDE